jgi:hypothetical protein
MEKRAGASQRAGFSTMAATDELPRGPSFARNTAIRKTRSYRGEIKSGILSLLYMFPRVLEEEARTWAGSTKWEHAI